MWVYQQPPGELLHYGILGMRWGVRRTPDQLARTGSGKTHREKSGGEKFDIDSMTDQELRDRVDRMMLERNYSRLTTKAKSRGADYVRSILDVAGEAIGVSTSASKLGSGKLTPSLTKAGEAVKSSSKIISDTKRVSNLSKRTPKPSVSSMSTQDLKNKVNRLTLEKNFKELTGEGSSDRGAKVLRVLDGVGAGLALTSSALAIALAIRKAKSGN